MDDYQSLSHTKWECKFHVGFLPKCRRKVLYGALRSHLGRSFARSPSRRSAAWRRDTDLPPLWWTGVVILAISVARFRKRLA